jgi:hypothetical protein
MPIEFRCTHCQRLLRVADGTEGKRARCPECGSIEVIPAAGPLGEDVPRTPPAWAEQAPPEAAPSAARAAYGSPFGAPPGTGADAPAPGMPPPVPEGFNPYASPTTSEGPRFQPSAAPRSGPAWERDGASFRSFFATIRDGFAPVPFFRDMRRQGGIAQPMLFAVLGGTLGTLVAMAYQLALQGAMVGLMQAGGGGAPGAPDASFFAVLLIGSVVCGLVIAPLAILIGTLINAAIVHLLLWMLGGANFPFETTYRVVAYCTGVTSMLLVVPLCGQYASAIVQIIWVIIGLCYAHETSGGKATAAVLIPVAVCCAGIVALYATLFAALLAGMPNGNF